MFPARSVGPPGPAAAREAPGPRGSAPAALLGGRPGGKPGLGAGRAAAYLGEPAGGTRAAGHAPARGRSGRRGAGTGPVLGAPPAASTAAALEPPRLGARDEPHPEKGLLQAGRQQDRLGAAQDLSVPDARWQRGLWRRVVRPLGLRARWGTRGAPGASGRTDGGHPGPGTQVEPPVWPGPGQCTSSALPDPPCVSPLLLGPRGHVLTTLTEDSKAQCPGGMGDPAAGFTEPNRVASWEAKKSVSRKPPAVAEAGLGPPQVPSPSFHWLCGLN